MEPWNLWQVYASCCSDMCFPQLHTYQVRRSWSGPAMCLPASIFFSSLNILAQDLSHLCLMFGWEILAPQAAPSMDVPWAGWSLMEWMGCPEEIHSFTAATSRQLK